MPRFRTARDFLYLPVNARFESRPASFVQADLTSVQADLTSWRLRYRSFAFTADLI